MNKQELTEMVIRLLEGMEEPEESPKPAPSHIPEEKEPGSISREEDAVADVTALDLRQLYLTKDPAEPREFARMKARTPARLGSGRAGPRYRTLTMLRFRADHAAAQDAVFSQVPEDFAEKNGLLPVQTRCHDKDEYLTRPDLGRTFDEQTRETLRRAIPDPPRVQLVIGDGLSSAAILANAMDCMAAIREGLSLQGIETHTPIFVRYCRVGAGDAIGDCIGCEVVCMLVGERPGLVTDKSMSAYITYRPRTGVSESSRTVVSNIHAQGTPAVEAGAHIARLIEKILARKISGVGLHQEGEP